MWRKLWEKFKRPSVKMLVVTYLVTAFCIAGALTLVFIGPVNTAVEILSYAAYGLAAVTLAYSVYTIVEVKAVQKIVNGVKTKLRTHRLTAKLMESYDFRTVFFAACSMAITVAYALYNGVIALMRIMPVWYGSLAGYYIILACMRGGILLYHGKRRGGKIERMERVELRKFRSCGILLIVVILSLSIAILQMVQADAGFDKPGMMIYVAAMYTFTKIATSIVNFIKARKHDDYTIGALRNVNLADAAVSILALQTSMFHSFGTEEVSTGFANALTGAGVCLVVCSLGVYMIWKGNKGLKKLREEEYDGEKR